MCSACRDMWAPGGRCWAPSSDLHDWAANALHPWCVSSPRLAVFRMGVPVVCSELVKCVVLSDCPLPVFRFLLWLSDIPFLYFILFGHQWMDIGVVAKKFVWMRAFICIRCLIRRGFAESYGNYLKRCRIGSEDTAVFHCQALSFSTSPAILIIFLFKI